MAENSKIEWTEHTWNPWVGCTKVSAACDHCYAETWAKRTGQETLWAGDRRRTSEANWRQPLRWNKRAKAEGVHPRVFVASLADVFDNQVPDHWRADMWTMIDSTRELTWLLLTKRPQNILKRLPPTWGEGWPHVWLGTTAEDERAYRNRWHFLAAVPATRRFLSYEPALGPIGDLALGADNSPDWVIAGGESGPRARPPEPAWFREARDQCANMGVPFLFKQWGEWAHGLGGMERVGKASAGRMLDGRIWDEAPPAR